ncbi:hypothetical protein [Amaricoccus sp.]|uniref:hypothetical protein n=1 Tax=Amaricoccus sp. TaxID=1872485 RepID=UPI002BECDECC|nr:hypothetical protein [Amaricoccus sp.]HRW15453.1 hypothetical protein [Amaricoccus sp.]
MRIETNCEVPSNLDNHVALAIRFDDDLSDQQTDCGQDARVYRGLRGVERGEQHFD